MFVIDCPHQWCNSYHIFLLCGRSWVRTPFGQKKILCYFYLLLSIVLRSTRVDLDWWARNQNMCRSWAICLPADWWFREPAL